MDPLMLLWLVDVLVLLLADAVCETVCSKLDLVPVRVDETVLLIVVVLLPVPVLVPSVEEAVLLCDEESAMLKTVGVRLLLVEEGVFRVMLSVVELEIDSDTRDDDLERDRGDVSVPLSRKSSRSKKTLRGRRTMFLPQNFLLPCG